VSTRFTLGDRAGAWLRRWGIGQARYVVGPGLYAVGEPGADSPVLVSANYKMSFDYLRRELAALDAWILVLDTCGVNVWCSAGKGTFGTEELVRRVKEAGLDQVVTHRTLVLPQLAAPGVSAHEVRAGTGFRVVYGPVRAADLPRFLSQGMKADTEMRRVRFGLAERAAVAPIEVVQGAPLVLVIAAAFAVLGGLGAGGFQAGRIFSTGLADASFVLAAFLAGSVVTPLLLPYLPGRPFSLKGAWAGMLSVLLLWAGLHGFAKLGGMGLAAWLLMGTALSSFVALNFTGASTYTSLSGVRKEMRFAVPLQAAAAVAGLALWAVERFVQ